MDASTRSLSHSPARDEGCAPHAGQRERSSSRLVRRSLVRSREHIYNEVIEAVPHRHTIFTIPKRLRVFFKYHRKLNTILFRAAWGALSQALGIDERELAAIFTVQTAGEALNYHPHLHGLLADGYWKDGVFTRLSEVDLKAIEAAFAERVLAQLHKRELITDDDVAKILSQDHTGCGVPVPRSLVRRGMARRAIPRQRMGRSLNKIRFSPTH
jgi:hypothetical protein